ncbi:hypothetical protein B0H10DRAFT_1967212 [Mycena sp. CBHHK59/15]|nr:hypothetical protein B0H10DRAFT_1967212 [Mycena sp. CBHHK59/15]
MPYSASPAFSMHPASSPPHHPPLTPSSSPHSALQDPFAMQGAAWHARSLGGWGITAEGSKNKLVRRATKFLSTIDKWDDDHWKDLIDTAKEYIETPGRKRARTTSRSGSEAGDDVIVSDDDGVMVLSD